MKEADGDEAPQPTCAMHGTCTDQIVNAQRFARRFGRDHHAAPDATDNQGVPGPGCVATRTDGDKAREDSVCHVDDVDAKSWHELLRRQQACGDAACHACERGIYGAHDGGRSATARAHAAGGARIEGKPADPQQQGALEHLWHVGRNEVSCQCWIPTVLPRAKDIRAHCSGHAARHVHDAAAGKVEEATLCE